jgi:Ca-activated chloride channel family protein
MKRVLAVTLSVAAVLLLVSASGSAQKPATPNTQNPQQPQRDDGQRIGVLEVQLPLAVKRNNKFVSGLNATNFEVYEDGKQQSIFNFLVPSQLPLNVALLVDTSNSVKLKLPFEKNAGEDFIATVTTHRRKDKVLLASFDSDVELHVDFTDNQEPLIRSLRALKAGGYTRMYDAVYRVIEEKLAHFKGTDVRRIIVVLSDGDDTASETTLKSAIEMAQKHDVTIFGISTKNFKGMAAGQVENEDDKELRKLCEATGGQVFLPSKLDQLFRSFSEIADDLRKEYVLFYKPTNQNKTNKEREIKIKLVRAEGELHYKQGYVY